MMATQEGDRGPRTTRASPWRLMTFPALAALFAFGVALALPVSPGPAQLQAGSQACLGAEVTLPPGHPPIGGRAVEPRDHGASLPPGHPPISGRRALRPAPPLPPTFEQPQIIDI